MKLSGRDRAGVVSLAMTVALAGCAGYLAPSPLQTDYPMPKAASPMASPAAAAATTMDVDAMRADLAELQGIADRNGGTRAVGTSGYDASVRYVSGELRKAGYQVTEQAFTMPIFHETQPAALSIDAGGSFAGDEQLHALIYSPSGEVSGRVARVGMDHFGNTTGRNGCSPSDWSEFPAGDVALVGPGSCFRRQQLTNAQQAGAVALVISAPGWPPGAVRRPTLIRPDNLRIPGLAASDQVRDALIAAQDADRTVHLRVSAATTQGPVINVVGELPGRDRNSAVMFGAHLDSALDGPGINDNGSGVAAVLELARVTARNGARGGSQTAPAKTARFAFWAGEEEGLWGSTQYVNSLSGAELHSISAYVNVDMVASPNFARFVYADPAAPSGSSVITRLFEAAFSSRGQPDEPLDLTGGTDHYAFEQAGVPVGGIFSGATEGKTDAQARTFGGSPGPMDSCYHLACDRLDRINLDALRQMTEALASVADELISGAVDPRPSG
ncbi:MAG: M28 family peptidase [Actinobacteria bacterium]|nr:M28 family peptidase [Actinomycetota bacterium]